MANQYRSQTTLTGTGSAGSHSGGRGGAPGKRTRVAQAYGSGAGRHRFGGGGESNPGAGSPGGGSSQSQPQDPSQQPVGQALGASYDSFIVDGETWQAAGSAASALQSGVVAVDSAGFTGSAFVSPAPGVDGSQYNVGYLQTVQSVHREWQYQTEQGSPFGTATLSFGTAMDQDGSVTVPWYQEPTALDNGVGVSMQDIPNFGMDAEVGGSGEGARKGHLRRTNGSESFITWLCAMPIAGGAPIPLRWASWRVNWIGIFSPDYNTYTGGQAAPTGLGRGRHGNPITTGQAANTMGQTPIWDGPGDAVPSGSQPRRRS